MRASRSATASDTIGAQTVPFDRSITESALPAPHLVATKRMLLVMSRSGVVTHELPPLGSVTIGRGGECDVNLDDVKASRKHALVFVGNPCTIEDTGSRNGTRVGDRTLAPNEPVPLRPGEMVTIGTTAIVLQLAADHAPPLRLWSRSAFDERFDRERAEGTSVFSLVRLTLRDAPAAALESTSTRSRFATNIERAEFLEQTFRESLRPTDIVGSTEPGVYEILMSATAYDEAAGIAVPLRRRLDEQRVAHTIAVSTFPRDGTTHEELTRNAIPLASDVLDATGEHSVEGLVTSLVRRIAEGEISVLILGETGVGKELMARKVHAFSRRSSGPLVCINCAALSESLLESELFGHEKGAFTGALEAKVGLLESAKGGTVFLDEVGEMPVGLQAKLLRVIEQREVLRVGAVRPRAIDVRFVSATNRDLQAEIAAGRFRSDLYFRLNGIDLVIPPLRDRTDEIAPLARAFIEQACEQSRRKVVPRIAPEVLDLITHYAWPGNVRELRNLMERAVLLTSGNIIALESFPAEMLSGPTLLPRAPQVSKRATAPERATMVPPQEEQEDDEASGDEDTLNTGPIDAILGMTDERERIVAALAACRGNQTHASKLLGISRRTLIMRLDDYALPRPRKK